MKRNKDIVGYQESQERFEIASEMNEFIQKYFAVNTNQDLHAALRICEKNKDRSLFAKAFYYSLSLGDDIKSISFKLFTLFIEENKDVEEYKKMLGYAEHMIAISYKKSINTGKYVDSEKLMIIHYNRAIQHNCPISMNKMADLYSIINKYILKITCKSLKIFLEKGKYVEKNRKKAIELYTESVKEGSLQAIVIMACKIIIFFFLLYSLKE